MSRLRRIIPNHRDVAASALAVVLMSNGTTASGREAILHLTIAGDLDSIALARETTDALVATTNTDMVILELDGNRWRSDVLWMLGSAIRDCSAPVVVLLRDPKDKRVGLGQLVLGLLATSCVIDPGTHVESDESGDRRSLIPEQTDMERVERELSGMVWVKLRHRGHRGELAESMLRSAGSAWIVDPPDGPPEIVLEPPTDPSAPRFIDVRADGTVHVSIDADTLAALRLVDDCLPDARRLIAAYGPSSGRIERRELKSQLGHARDELDSVLRAADDATHGVERELDRVDHPPDDRVVPASAYREAGRAGLNRLAAARSLVEQAERLFDSHPELLRTPAPAGTPVGRTSERNTADWRLVFLDRRRTIERLEDRARRFASR
ncbi:MAG: hypothetical protein H6811_07395 [Phycisphaeraceae bacterium]|nr:hypothetical protein [Phycisphaeraceae bacterium]